jgi:hypothetical protein
MARPIELTQGYVALVDDSDFEMLSKFSWHAHRTDGKVYARRSYAIPGTRKKGKQYMHRLLLSHTPLQIDHIDGDGLNNQRSNLRPVTGTQNQGNAKARSDNRSGRKGVHRRFSRAKNGNALTWVARCKRRYLGTFGSVEDAAIAYDCAAIAAFGQHAKTNLDPLLYANSSHLKEAIDKGLI